MTNGGENQRLLNAASAILSADTRLTSHIRKKLGHGKMRQKNLICGKFNEFLNEEASRRDCSARMIWSAFHDASMRRREIFRSVHKLPDGGFHHEIYHYLLELFDGDRRALQR